MRLCRLVAVSILLALSIRAEAQDCRSIGEAIRHKLVSGYNSFQNGDAVAVRNSCNGVPAERCHSPARCKNVAAALEFFDKMDAQIKRAINYCGDQEAARTYRNSVAEARAIAAKFGREHGCYAGGNRPGKTDKQEICGVLPTKYHEKRTVGLSRVDIACIRVRNTCNYTIDYRVRRTGLSGSLQDVVEPGQVGKTCADNEHQDLEYLGWKKRGTTNSLRK